MSEQCVELHRTTHIRERTRPRTAHRVSNGNTHWRSFRLLVFIEAVEKIFEILNGYTPCRSASGNTRQISSVKAQFVHARLHPWRHICEPARVRGNRKTVDCRHDIRRGSRGIVTIGISTL